MATLADITVPTGAYLDLYSAAGLTDGTAIQIVNKGVVMVYIQENITQPSATSTDGRVITPITGNNAVLDISSGSDKIWVRASGVSSVVNVEVV